MNVEETIEHYRKLRQKQRAVTEKLKQEAMQATLQLSDSSLQHVREGVSRVYTRQKLIKEELLALQKRTTEFDKKTEKWLHKYNSLNGSLRELGSVKAWAIGISSRLNTVNDLMVKIVHSQGGTVPIVDEDDDMLIPPTRQLSSDDASLTGTPTRSPSDIPFPRGINETPPLNRKDPALSTT